MKEFAADGVKIVTPAHNVPGLYKVAFIEDPWGTRIEVVQDPDLLGLHHIQIVGPNTEDIFTWLLAQFGGRRTKLKGTVDAIKYSVPSFTDIWILVERGDSEPSLGHSIDHISWRSTGSLTKWLDDLRAKGVTITAEPHIVVLPTGLRSVQPTWYFQQAFASSSSNVRESNPGNSASRRPLPQHNNLSVPSP